MAAKFKKEVIEDLKKSFEMGELETINILLEGNKKCNSIKKKDLETTFRKVICLLSKELDWLENDVITQEETNLQEVENSSEEVTEDQKKKVT